MAKHTCKSGRTYLINADLAEPCFNGAGFTVQIGTVDDLEEFDGKLKCNNMTGQYE